MKKFCSLKSNVGCWMIILYLEIAQRVKSFSRCYGAILNDLYNFYEFPEKLCGNELLTFGMHRFPEEIRSLSSELKPFVLPLFFAHSICPVIPKKPPAGKKKLRSCKGASPVRAELSIHLVCAFCLPQAEYFLFPGRTAKPVPRTAAQSNCRAETN